MKPKDYINKKTKEEALKAFGATQLNNNQETSPYFVGKISADRKKITDPLGRQYNLTFSGNPGQFELAQRLSNESAYVDARKNKQMNVDGSILRSIIITEDSSGISGNESPRFYLNFQGIKVEITSEMDGIELYTASELVDLYGYENNNSPGYGFFARLSTDGKSIILFKSINVSLQRPGETYNAPRVSIVTSRGSQCDSPGCSILNTDYTDFTVPRTITDFKTVFYASYKILTNIKKQGNTLSWDTFFTATNVEMMTEDNFPESGINFFTSGGPDPPTPTTVTLATLNSVGKSLNGYAGIGSSVLRDLHFIRQGTKVQITLIGSWSGVDSTTQIERGTPSHRYPASYCAVDNIDWVCGTVEPPVLLPGPVIQSNVLGATQVFLSRGVFVFGLVKEVYPDLQDNFVLFNSYYDLGPSILGGQILPTLHSPANNPNFSNINPSFLYSNPYIEGSDYSVQVSYILATEDGLPAENQKTIFLTPYTEPNELNQDYPEAVSTEDTVGPTMPILINNSVDFFGFSVLGVEDLGMITYQKNSQFVCWSPRSTDDPNEIIYQMKRLHLTFNEDLQSYITSVSLVGNLQEFSDFGDREYITSMAFRN